MEYDRNIHCHLGQYAMTWGWTGRNWSVISWGQSENDGDSWTSFGLCGSGPTDFNFFEVLNWSSISESRLVNPVDCGIARNWPCLNLGLVGFLSILWIFWLHLTDFSFVGDSESIYQILVKIGEFFRSFGSCLGTVSKNPGPKSCTCSLQTTQKDAESGIWKSSAPDIYDFLTLP